MSADIEIKIARDNQDIYAMGGWRDASGDHPGDGIPRLWCVNGQWRLWYMLDPDSVTSVALGEDVTERWIEQDEEWALEAARRYLSQCLDRAVIRIQTFGK